MDDRTVPRRATPERLSAFSEGVFAVLITVLVLELRLPASPTFKALLLLWPTWLSYAVSYLFIHDMEHRRHNAQSARHCLCSERQQVPFSTNSSRYYPALRS